MLDAPSPLRHCAPPAQDYDDDEVEDEDWHEDTPQWKERMVNKHAPKFDIEKLTSGGPLNFDPLDFNRGGMKMAFVTLQDEWCDKVRFPTPALRSPGPRPYCSCAWQIAECRSGGPSSSASCCTTDEVWKLGHKWMCKNTTPASSLTLCATTPATSHHRPSARHPPPAPVATTVAGVDLTHPAAGAATAFAALLKTGAIDVKPTATAGTKMMLVDNDGHMKDVRPS